MLIKSRVDKVRIVNQSSTEPMNYYRIILNIEST